LRAGAIEVWDRVLPTERQQEFRGAVAACPTQGHVGFGGAIRAGKSQVACRMVVGWAWTKPADYLIGRKTYRRLADTTRKIVVAGDGGLRPAAPPELWEDYRMTDNELVLTNGARILFRAFEHPVEAVDMVKNMTLAGYMIDQVEELDDPAYEELFNTLQGRLSDPRGPRVGLTVSNPGPEDHWYYRRVVDRQTRDADTFYVHAELLDNVKHLPEKYVAGMLATEATRPDWYRRYIRGQWGAFGGKRFKVWDKRSHVMEPFDIDPGWEIIEAVDYGWANPTAVLWLAIDYLNRWYVVAEHYGSEMRISEHATVIKQVRERFNLQPSSIWLDPSAWARRGQFQSPAMEFQDNGILVVPAQNDRLGGWNRIEEMLTAKVETAVSLEFPEDEPDSSPQLRIFDRCTNLIRELPNLRIKEGTDDVEKRNDHAADALRYAVMSRTPAPIEKPKHPRDLRHERRLAYLQSEPNEKLYHTA
jgi:PBSX family phage terminase large subunit